MVSRSGRARKLRGARVTASHAYPVRAVVSSPCTWHEGAVVPGDQ